MADPGHCGRLPALTCVTAFQAWGQHITGLLAVPLDRNGAVLDNARRPWNASPDVPALAEPLAPASAVARAALIHAACPGAADQFVVAGRKCGAVPRDPATPAPTAGSTRTRHQTATSDWQRP